MIHCWRTLPLDDCNPIDHHGEWWIMIASCYYQYLVTTLRQRFGIYSTENKSMANSHVQESSLIIKASDDGENWYNTKCTHLVEGNFKVVFLIWITITLRLRSLRRFQREENLPHFWIMHEGLSFVPSIHSTIQRPIHYPLPTFHNTIIRRIERLLFKQHYDERGRVLW